MGEVEYIADSSGKGTDCEKRVSVSRSPDYDAYPRNRMDR